MLKLRDYRPTVLPLAMIAIIVSLIVYPDIVYFRTFAKEIWPLYALTFGLLGPLLLLIVSALRQSGSATNVKRQ